MVTLGGGLETPLFPCVRAPDVFPFTEPLSWKPLEPGAVQPGAQKLSFRHQNLGLLGSSELLVDLHSLQEREPPGKCHRGSNAAALVASVLCSDSEIKRV